MKSYTYRTGVLQDVFSDSWGLPRNQMFGYCYEIAHFSPVLL